MNVWKTCHYTSDHGGRPTVKSLVQRQRRTGDQVLHKFWNVQQVGVQQTWQTTIEFAGTTGYWLGVQQHSVLVEVCLSQTSAPRLVQSYSNRGESWQRRARVSSRTQRRVNVGVGLASVFAKSEKNTWHTRWRRACGDWGPMISSRQGLGRDHSLTANVKQSFFVKRDKA